MAFVVLLSYSLIGLTKAQWGDLAYAIRLTDEAENDGAVCIDGTPGVYYLSKTESAESKNKWIVYFEGGGWCSGNEISNGLGFDSCLDRSQTVFGSSSSYLDFTYFGTFNQLSDDQTQNPLMYDWNKALLKYCDGASFGGNRDEPINVTNTTGHVVSLYSRGHRYILYICNLNC